jgi:hypothetical protein
MSTPTSTSPPAADFDNASIADVLSLAGISDSAVTAFIEVHTTALRPMSMAKFLSNLRSIGDDTTLVPELFSRRFRLRTLELRPNDWDSEYETDLLIALSHWFYQQEHYDNTFDWQSNLDPTDFRRYANSYKRSGLASPARTRFTTPAPSSTGARVLQPTVPPTLPPRPAPSPTAPVTAPLNLFGPRDSSPPTTQSPRPPVYPPTVPLADPMDTLPNAPPDLAPAPPPHSYHDAILAADRADYARRAATTSVDTTALGPRLWRNCNITAINMDTKQFLSTPLHRLVDTLPTTVHTWYSNLVLQATACNIDLCPLREFSRHQVLWPDSLPQNLVLEMANVILMKISPLIDVTTNPTLQLLFDSEVTHSNSKLAGYKFLHALLTLANISFQQRLPTRPRFDSTMDPVAFATAYLQYQQDEARKNRVYTDRELSSEFIHELLDHDYPIHVQHRQLLDVDVTSPTLPSSLHFRNLALSVVPLYAHRSTGPVHSTGPGTGSYTAHRLTSSTDTRTVRPPTSTGRRGNSTTTSLTSATSTSNDPTAFRQREELQCAACGTWGHKATHCSQFAKLNLLTKYSASHPRQFDAAGAAWLALHNASNRRPIAHLLHAIPTQENATFYDDDSMNTTQDPLFLSPDPQDFQSPG